MKQIEAKKLKETKEKIESKVKAVRKRNSKKEREFIFFCTIFLYNIYKVLHVNSLINKNTEVDLECKVEIHKELLTISGSEKGIKKCSQGPIIGRTKCKRNATPEKENQGSTEKTHISRKCTIFETERKCRDYYECGRYISRQR